MINDINWNLIIYEKNANYKNWAFCDLGRIILWSYKMDLYAGIKSNFKEIEILLFIFYGLIQKNEMPQK